MSMEAWSIASSGEAMGGLSTTYEIGHWYMKCKCCNEHVPVHATGPGQGLDR